MYKKILLPVDGSENALLACRHAIDLAKSCAMEIVLLNCYGELSARIGGAARNEIISELEAEAKSILGPCESLCAESGLNYKTLICCGGPARIIVQVAQSEGCDIIVIGSRGLSEFAGMVLGSVTHRVLRHSTVPVLVVR
jgi:nucleotide-binding universal stress UspA family protein